MEHSCFILILNIKCVSFTYRYLFIFELLVFCVDPVSFDHLVFIAERRPSQNEVISPAYVVTYDDVWSDVFFIIDLTLQSILVGVN